MKFERGNHRLFLPVNPEGSRTLLQPVIKDTKLTNKIKYGTQGNY
jgi:hypothetical protein